MAAIVYDLSTKTFSTKEPLTVKGFISKHGGGDTPVGEIVSGSIGALFGGVDGYGRGDIRAERRNLRKRHPLSIRDRLDGAIVGATLGSVATRDAYNAANKLRKGWKEEINQQKMQDNLDNLRKRTVKSYRDVRSSVGQFKETLAQNSFRSVGGG